MSLMSAFKQTILQRATETICKLKLTNTINENQVGDIDIKTLESMRLHLCAFDNNVRACCVKYVACLHPVRCDATSHEVARADVVPMLTPYWLLLSTNAR